MLDLAWRGRNWPDGTTYSGPAADLIIRLRTEAQVPVPSRRDALGQHFVARAVARAGFPHLPPYHPERKKA